MYQNQFSVRVEGGVEKADNYVEMSHGQTYALVMRNDRCVQCDAIVSIDSQHVGTWRIPAKDSIRIERPAGKARLFTFYRLDSAEARQAALIDDDMLGLISVEFRPEKERPAFPAYSPDVTRGAKGFGTFSAGGTGLSGSSSQSFGIAARIDHDMANAFTIHLRLVSRDSTPAIEPLTPRSTPVPPRVG